MKSPGLAAPGLVQVHPPAGLVRALAAVVVKRPWFDPTGNVRSTSLHRPRSANSASTPAEISRRERPDSEHSRLTTTPHTLRPILRSGPTTLLAAGSRRMAAPTSAAWRTELAVSTLSGLSRYATAVIYS